MADSQATKQQSLLEYVLELILIRPVDWYSAQKQIFSALAHSRQSSSPPIHVLNFGPGYGVSRAHGDANVQVEDVSTDSEASNPLKGSTPKSDDDVAIIGMAVDLPGAPDTVGLWRVLADKVNAVSEVVFPSFPVPAMVIAKSCRSLNPASTLKIFKTLAATLIIPKGHSGRSLAISSMTPSNLIIPFSAYLQGRPNQLTRNSVLSCRQRTRP